MNRSDNPPFGYYITDYEKDIREICACLEDEGMRYKLVDDFEIQYISDSVVIYIIFEKNGDAVSVEYSLPNSTPNGNQFSQAETFSIGWTIVEFLDEEQKVKYLPKRLSKLDKVKGCIQFYEDYRDLLLDNCFATKLREKYDRLLV